MDNEFAGSNNIADVSGECFNRVTVFADSVWFLSSDNPFILQHRLTRFNVQLIVMVFITNFVHYFFHRIYLPRFTSEFLTGMLLGPTFFETGFSSASRELFPPVPDIVISSLVKFGYTLFVFTAGVRMDPYLVSRIGRKAWILGLVMSIVPLALAFTLNGNVKEGETEAIENERESFDFIYFSTITASQFVGVTNVLMQLKITNSRLGHLALVSTLISDLIRFGYSGLLSYLNACANISYSAGSRIVILSILFFLVIIYPLRFFMLWFIRNTEEDKPMKDIYTSLVVALVLTLASMADSVGLYYAFGPFFLGLVVPAGSPLAANLLKKLEPLVLGLFIPLLTTFCGMKFDLWSFIINLSRQGFLFKITLVGFIFKLVATYIVAIACKLGPKDATAFTLIVNAKGVLEVGMLLSFGRVQNRDFDTTSGIFLVFLLATATTPLVKILYDPTKQYIGHYKKSIAQAPYDAELRIVACAYKQEDAIAATKLLKYSNPTKQSPITIYGLCLEELVSSDTPVWIDHQLGQKRNANQQSRSQPLIEVLKYIKSQHKKLIQVHAFTAISPLNQMHEDICWLSFEKVASLVIVPFHKKWNTRGKLVSVNADIRALNINVLKRAPCSVGILVYRPRDHALNSIFDTSTKYHVCVVFVGGSDDREALAYSLRIARSDGIQLTVLHLTIPEDLKRNNWDAILDSEALRSMKDTIRKHNLSIDYIEETVRDGSETASILGSMQDRFELFIVGRRHEFNPRALFGLLEWVELDELGPIGDFLASTDVTCPVSVLVVQQQITKASHSCTLD